MEAAATDALARQRREEILDRVEPGSRGRREVKGPTRMTFEPCFDLRVLVRGVVVNHRFDQLAGRDRALHIVKKADELLMSVLLHAATNHRAVEHVQGSEQRR